MWNAYLPWAKVNKKIWDDDQYHYHRHIEPRFGNKPLDAISPLDVEKMKNELGNATNMNGKLFAPQSIKHYLKRVQIFWNEEPEGLTAISRGVRP